MLVSIESRAWFGKQSASGSGSNADILVRFISVPARKDCGVPERPYAFGVAYGFACGLCLKTSQFGGALGPSHRLDEALSTSKTGRSSFAAIDVCGPWHSTATAGSERDDGRTKPHSLHQSSGRRLRWVTRSNPRPQPEQFGLLERQDDEFYPHREPVITEARR